AMPWTHDLFALDGAADAQVRPQVLAIRVEHVDPPGLGPEDHQLFAEVVGAFHLPGSKIRGESHDEPPRREPVWRQPDSTGPEFPFRRIHGRVRTEVRHGGLPFPTRPFVDRRRAAAYF